MTLRCTVCLVDLEDCSTLDLWEAGCSNPTTCCYKEEVVLEAGWTKKPDGSWRRPDERGEGHG